MTDYQKAQNAQDWLGMNVASRLSRSTTDLPHDITERLKVARTQALAKRKVLKPQVAQVTSFNDGGAASLNFGGGDDRSLWNRIASMLPLIALIAGLLIIATIAEDNWTSDIAEVDAQLLTDDLPPDAYTDPGFAQFLRLKQND
jgi:hypothetical protein